MYNISKYKKDREYQEAYIHEHFNMECKCNYLGRRDRDGWECFAYSITLCSTIHPNPKSFTLEFYNGVGHVFNTPGNPPAAPLPFSILSSIFMEDTRGASFDEWCSEYGYDTDSRKALAAYLQCQEQTSNFKKAFPEVDLEEHEEIIGY